MPLLLISGCSSLHDFFGSAPNKREPEIVVPLEERPVEEPLSANHFVLESPDQAVVGTPQVVYTTEHGVIFDWDWVNQPRARSDGSVPVSNDYRFSVGLGLDF